MSMACLLDTTRCIGCRACQVACKQWHDLPAEKTRCLGKDGGYENPTALSSVTYTRVTFHEIEGLGGQLERTAFVKRQCMHCLHPSCVSACPVTALLRTREGAVVYDAQKCMGCRYCMMACPFHVPTLEWDKLAPRITKCDFCIDRQHNELATTQLNGTPMEGETLQRFRAGQEMPVCAKVCPTDAIQFGDRDKLIAEAGQRIRAQNAARDSWRYIDHIYGEHEVGGTAWLYVSNVSFDKLGFRTDLGEKPYPEYTEEALDAIPLAVIGVGAAMGGVYWFVERRNRLATAASSEAAGTSQDVNSEE